MQSAQFQLHADIEQRHWWFVGRRAILGALVERLAPPGGRIVDVGCGTGGNLAEFAGRYACVGIDTSAEAVGHARRRFPEIEFLCGSAPEDLGDVASQADLFLLLDVLEHVDDDRDLLRRLVEAARPGARLLITVPADPALWSPHDVSFGHYRRYDRQRFQALWDDLPIEAELSSAFNSRLYWPIRAARFWAKRRASACGRDGTDFALPSAPVNALLTRLFGGERRRLLRELRLRQAAPRRGVSLAAVLRKTTCPASDEPSSPAQLSAMGCSG